MDRGTSTEEHGTISLQIAELWRRSAHGGSSNTFFEPQSSNGSYILESSAPTFRAPEKKLTLFALRLAILEKTATGLGALGFIWATVVLLGGFAITLDKTDFWIITVILLIEGARIFSRSHELEWQHEATWSVADAGRNSFRALRSHSRNVVQAVKSMLGPNFKPSQSQEKTENVDGNETRPRNIQRLPTRTWKSSDVPLLPYDQWVFLARNISKILYWLQLASATACIFLSLMKLIKRDFGEVEKGDTDKRNRHSALLIFYSLALAEALLFLLEKAYWEWKVTYCKLLEEVNRECDLGVSGMVSIRRFFYDAYSRCVNGSIFDGLKMDMVSLAMELLNSDFPDEQLVGARILRQFATNERFSSDTLQKIGINLSVMERLVEMLNWKDPQDEEIRRSAAEILSKLACKKQNSLRVAGIPGAMESISSLLQTRRTPCAADEIGEKNIVFDHITYGFCTFNHLGLLILKKLSRDHDNCGKIGNTRGLLPKIIDFSHFEENLLRDALAASSQILTVKYSLQLVKMLASTTGTTGKLLRKEISEVVFTISNIRDILKHGDKHPSLQKLGIQILASLALEDDTRENIGGTGGILKELFNIFFKEEMPENQSYVRIAAGEALAMLALDSEANCFRILKLKVVDKLKEALEIPFLRVNAARILKNLCAYSGEDHFNHLRGLETAAPTVLKAIIFEEDKLQEVMIGLAAHVFKFMTSEESSIMFERTGVQEIELADALVRVLKKYHQPPIKVPRIRRFAIELAIWMMRDKVSNLHIFRQLGLEEELEVVLETTSELENFNIFSGTIGLSRHSTKIHSLVETALKLLTER